MYQTKWEVDVNSKTYQYKSFNMKNRGHRHLKQIWTKIRPLRIITKVLFFKTQIPKVETCGRLRKWPNKKLLKIGSICGEHNYKFKVIVHYKLEQSTEFYTRVYYKYSFQQIQNDWDKCKLWHTDQWKKANLNDIIFFIQNHEVQWEQTHFYKYKK